MPTRCEIEKPQDPKPELTTITIYRDEVAVCRANHSSNAEHTNVRHLSKADLGLNLKRVSIQNVYGSDFVIGGQILAAIAIAHESIGGGQRTLLEKGRTRQIDFGNNL